MQARTCVRYVFLCVLTLRRKMAAHTFVWYTLTCVWRCLVTLCVHVTVVHVVLIRVPVEWRLTRLFGTPFTAQVSNKDACMMAAHTFVWYTLHCTGVKQGRCRCEQFVWCTLHCTGVKQGRMHDGGSHVCLVHPSLHRCQTRTVQMQARAAL